MLKEHSCFKNRNYTKPFLYANQTNSCQQTATNTVAKRVSLQIHSNHTKTCTFLILYDNNIYTNKELTLQRHTWIWRSEGIIMPGLVTHIHKSSRLKKILTFNLSQVCIITSETDGKPKTAQVSGGKHSSPNFFNQNHHVEDWIILNVSTLYLPDICF